MVPRLSHPPPAADPLNPVSGPVPGLARASAKCRTTPRGDDNIRSELADAAVEGGRAVESAADQIVELFRVGLPSIRRSRWCLRGRRLR